MAWTYGNDPSFVSGATAEQLRDAVRLTIGDTDTNDQQLSDEEIAAYLAVSSNNVKQTARRAVEALWAKYARQADTKHGKLDVKASQRAKTYKELLDRMDSEEGLDAQMFVGGISKDGKEDLANDSDNIDPLFEVGQDDHPNGYGRQSRYEDERY